MSVLTSREMEPPRLHSYCDREWSEELTVEVLPSEFGNDSLSGPATLVKLTFEVETGSIRSLECWFKEAVMASLHPQRVRDSDGLFDVVIAAIDRDLQRKHDGLTDADLELRIRQSTEWDELRDLALEAARRLRRRCEGAIP